MKKYIFVLMTCLTMFASLNAKNCGYYFGGFAGANWLHVNKVDGVSIHNDPGYILSGSWGYKFRTHTRLEAEVAYRRNKLNHLQFQNQKYGVGGFANSTTLMANLYQEIPYFNLFAVPYMGIGAGYTHLKDNVSAGGYRFKGSGNGFAWQVMAGLNLPVLKCTELGLEYRFFQGRHSAYDHSLGLALRYFY